VYWILETSWVCFTIWMGKLMICNWYRWNKFFLINEKDSIDFEKRLEPTRPEFEAEAEIRGKPRINPVTGVCFFFIISID